MRQEKLFTSRESLILEKGDGQWIPIVWPRLREDSSIHFLPHDNRHLLSLCAVLDIIRRCHCHNLSCISVPCGKQAR